MTEQIKHLIDTAWDNRDNLVTTDQDVLYAVIDTLTKLDKGQIRVAV